MKTGLVNLSHGRFLKMRKTSYKLQKYGLVLTYEDVDNRVWKLLMPDEVREAFARVIDESIEYKELHPKKLSRKEKMLEDYLNSSLSKDS